MMGICGTGMGSLAGLFKEKGYRVTGSDSACYPPISNQLENLGIKPMLGYSADNLKGRPDLVIIGNVIPKSNPEAAYVLANNIPYISMPEAVEKSFLADKESIVITGTHGKTTTSNITAWLLDYAGKNPGFLIGGVGLNFGKSYRYTDSNYFVIEGDEYDTAFFDKGPKFLHYRPKYAIISSLEFDHADIYKDLKHVQSSFAKLLQIVPKDGICLVNADSESIKEISDNAQCKLITYGFSKEADYRLEASLDNSDFTIHHAGNRFFFETPLIGRHNILNAASAIIILMQIGIAPELLASGLKEFKGVKRRQEVRAIVNDIQVIDDFAHHPTAILETIDGFKTKYPEKRLWAIFEPRSNTTRRKVFQGDLATAFDKADKVIISDVFHSADIRENERLDPVELVSSINKNGDDAFFITKTDYIIEFLVRNAQPGDIMLIMSNGAFDNIHEKLISELKKRRFHGA